MGTRLWFIAEENGKPLKVFPSRRTAEYELEAMAREEETGVEYVVYPIYLDELEEHERELELAEEEGYV